jgi:hypothetical protein
LIQRIAFSITICSKIIHLVAPKQSFIFLALSFDGCCQIAEVFKLKNKIIAEVESSVKSVRNQQEIDFTYICEQNKDVNRNQFNDGKSILFYYQRVKH